MTRQIDRPTLIRLLQQFTPMQRSLRDQSIVILLSKASCSLKGTSQNTYSLELRSRVADRIFIDRECLGEELVAEFFKAGLIRDLAAGDEETET